MPDLPTRIDLFNIGADEILNRSAVRPPGQRLDPAQVFTAGSDINIITASASAMAEEVLRQATLRVKALYLDGADDIQLDRLVADRYSTSIVRKDAVPAAGTVVVSRVAGAFPAVTLPVGTKFKTDSGVAFISMATASIALGSTGPVTIIIQAVQAGLSGNVASGTITQFFTPPSDPNLLVANLEPAAGGDERETDASLRERARSFFLAARRGTLAAITFGALTVAGVRQATAIEERTPLGDPTGRVYLYVADAQGNGNSILVAAVLAALVEYRAAGIIVDVSGAIPLFVSIVYNLRFLAGIDTTAAFAQIQTATIAAVNALAPGQTLTVSLLFATARSVPGVIVLDDAIVAPVGDLVPVGPQVIRTRADLVSSL